MTDTQTATSPLDYTVATLDGQDVALKRYLGHPVLIVNVASECGLTPQYAGLEALYRQYMDKGLRILAFPCNDFGAQEPGTPEQIRQFCDTRYDVSFDLFEKVTVKGDHKHPVYDFLTSEATNPGLSGDIEWNFAKFLLDKHGKVVARFHPKVEPQAAELTGKIDELLMQ